MILKPNGNGTKRTPLHTYIHCFTNGRLVPGVIDHMHIPAHLAGANHTYFEHVAATVTCTVVTVTVTCTCLQGADGRQARECDGPGEGAAQ